MGTGVRSGSFFIARRWGDRAVPVLAVAASLAVLGVTLGLMLRWPAASAPDAPALPVSIGGVVFNVPPAAIRHSRQRRAGAQSRLDLEFLWPALVPPDPAAKPVGLEQVPPIDRVFVTIAIPDDALGPAERLKSIYPLFRFRPLRRPGGPHGDPVSR
jgi:hypothetical protein